MLYLVLIAIIIGLIVGVNKYRKLKSKANVYIPLKETGRKVIVDFKKCDIKTRDYYEDINPDETPSRMEIIDSLYHPNNKAIKQVKKVVSVITFEETDNNGDEIIYRSEAIYLPAESLRYILDNKKETILYIDQNNPRRYYFDTGFLY